MIQAHRESFAPDVIVEVPELASRFRETQRTIKDALALLRDMARAEPLHLADVGSCSLQNLYAAKRTRGTQGPLNLLGFITFRNAISSYFTCYYFTSYEILRGRTARVSSLELTPQMAVTKSERSRSAAAVKS